MLRTILVSSYLGGDEGKGKLRYFEAVDAVLREQGFRLLLLNTEAGTVKSSCDTERLPIFIEKAHHLRLERLLTKDNLGADVLRAASIDAEEWKRDPMADAVRVLFFRAFLRNLMVQHDTVLCVFWHEFNTLHDSMREFCSEVGVPLLFAEYGSLPGTIVFDTDGQMAESWIVQRSDEFLKMPVFDEDLAKAGRLLQMLREGKRMRKPGAESKPLAPVSEKASSEGRALIFYAGQNDYKAGLAPRTHPNAAVHSPFYKSTNDALRDLCAIAEERNWQILFKPHPMAEHLLKDLVLPFPDRVDIVSGADIFECLDAADVTVTLVSQVSYMALIHGRPCVVLGRNQLSGKGCVYEAESRESAGDTIAVAIRDGLSQKQRDAWLRHTAQLCTHVLFAFDEDLEAIIGRDAREVAEFLIGHADADVRGPEGVSAHALSLFGGDLPDGRAARSLERYYALLLKLEPLTRRVLKSFGGRLASFLRRRPA